MVTKFADGTVISNELFVDATELEDPNEGVDKNDINKCKEWIDGVCVFKKWRSQPKGGLHLMGWYEGKRKRGNGDVLVTKPAKRGRFSITMSNDEERAFFQRKNGTRLE